MQARTYSHAIPFSHLISGENIPEFLASREEVWSQFPSLAYDIDNKAGKSDEELAAATANSTPTATMTDDEKDAAAADATVLSDDERERRDYESASVLDDDGGLEL
jgi:hypothetical protein